MDSTGPKWVPGSAEERKFYDGLFQMADVTKTGKLAGQPAVAFLGRSGLAMPVLKQIWDISCDPKLGYLRCEDFYVAMRLIATAQSSAGTPITAERLKADSTALLPMPRMQGLPIPPAGMLSKGIAVGSADTSTVHEGFPPVDPYAMTPQERLKYQSLFPRYDTDQDGFITGQETHALFSKSGLPREQLRQIWDLSDADNDNKLSVSEFCVGMHLIVCASKKGLAIPATLPRSLAPSLAPSPSPNGSSGAPVLQSPSRPLPTVQPLSTPPSGRGLSLGATATDLGDAFSELSADLPVKGPASSIGSEAENEVTPPASTLEPSPAAAESSLSAEQPQDKLAWRSADAPVSGKSVSRGGSSEGSWVAPPSSQSDIQELTTAHNTLMAATQGVSSAHSQVMAAQSSSVNTVSALVQKLQLEKTSLSAMVEAGKAERMANERQLREVGVELESLHAELDKLRNQFQEEQEEARKLRERLSQANLERATTLAEIKALKTALGTQQAEIKQLQQEEGLVDDTRNALQSYKASIGQTKATQKSEAPQQPMIPEETSTPSAEGVSSSPPPPPSKFEAKSEAPPEPAMPARTPPPPPESMTSPRVVEDPFADMMRKEDAEIHLPSRTEAPVVPGSMKPQSGDEEKNDGFDAFPPVGEAFESDPFAVNGFNGDGPADDPFAATDAAFTDGFDAFPAPSEAQFDAFGQ